MKIFLNNAKFFILGALASVTCFAIVVHAAWNDRVVPSQALTSTLWNDLVAEVEDLNNRVTTIDNQVNNEGFSNIADGTIEVCIQCRSNGGANVIGEERCVTTSDSWSDFTPDLGWHRHSGSCRIYIRY